MDLQELIKGCIRQDRKAQEALYNQYKNALYVLSLKYCASQPEAEDNLHNAFIEIFTKIGHYKNKGSFEGWIKRIAINKAIDSYKKKYHLVPLHDNLAEDTQIETSELDFSLDQILALIQELPNQYRLVFCLYELDDYSHQEIAQLLSISESTSKSNLHRAKIILKEKIRNKNTALNYHSGNGK